MPWLESTIPTSVIKAVDLDDVLSDSSQPARICAVCDLDRFVFYSFVWGLKAALRQVPDVSQEKQSLSLLPSLSLLCL